MEQLGQDAMLGIGRAVFSGVSYREVARVLQLQFPNIRGLSEKSVRRYCKRFQIEPINDQDLDRIMQHCIFQVGLGLLLKVVTCNI